MLDPVRPADVFDEADRAGNSTERVVDEPERQGEKNKVSESVDPSMRRTASGRQPSPGRA
jgi:hypothetical protein